MQQSADRHATPYVLHLKKLSWLQHRQYLFLFVNAVQAVSVIQTTNMKYADILKPKKTKTKHMYHKDSKYSFMILTILYLLVSVIPVVHIVLLHISMMSVQYCDVRYAFHDVRLDSHLFWREFMFYLCCLYLFTHTSVQHDFHVRWFSCLLPATWQVSLVEQELPTLPGFFCGCRILQ